MIISINKQDTPSIVRSYNNVFFNNADTYAMLPFDKNATYPTSLPSDKNVLTPLYLLTKRTILRVPGY